MSHSKEMSQHLCLSRGRELLWVWGSLGGTCYLSAQIVHLGNTDWPIGGERLLKEQLQWSAAAHPSPEHDARVWRRWQCQYLLGGRPAAGRSHWAWDHFSGASHPPPRPHREAQLIRLWGLPKGTGFRILFMEGGEHLSHAHRQLGTELDVASWYSN